MSHHSTSLCSARQHGVDAYDRPGWFINLEGPYNLDRPLTLAWLRDHEQLVRAVRAELKEAHFGTLYFPFAISDTRPLRAAQTYMVKFPAALVRQVPILAASAREAATTRTAAAPPPLGLGLVGSEYRKANEDPTTAGRDPFDVDPTLVDRALRGHARTQNALANWLRSRGLEPRSAMPREPQFDIAWTDGPILFVAEVKSLTKRNEEQQLRLGLGQVLRYRNILSTRTQQVRAVLAIERQPSDPRWMALCAEHDVRLVWPPAFSALTYVTDIRAGHVR